MSYWKAKYIIGGYNQEPIVFPETIQHADMARNLGWVGDERKVVGAGFVLVRDDQYHVYGESVSLRVKNRGEQDEKILNKYLGGRYDE
jgi:hypothetical protein